MTKNEYFKKNALIGWIYQFAFTGFDSTKSTDMLLEFSQQQQQQQQQQQRKTLKLTQWLVFWCTLRNKYMSDIDDRTSFRKPYLYRIKLVHMNGFYWEKGLWIKGQDEIRDNDDIHCKSLTTESK